MPSSIQKIKSPRFPLFFIHETGDILEKSFKILENTSFFFKTSIMSAITGKLYPNDPSARPVSTAQYPVPQGTVPLRRESRPEWRSAPLGLFLRRSPPIDHPLPVFAVIPLVATRVLNI